MDLLASFAGAAIAFGFFLLGQAMTRAYERRRLHFNALVTLERILNLQLDEAHLIRNQVPEMQAPIDRGQALVALPRPILETDDLYVDLLDLELTNALIDNRISVHRLNHDIDNIREAYEALKGRYLDGSLDRETYISSSGFLIGKYEELAQALESLERQVTDLIVRVRLRLREPRPWSFRLIGKLSSIRLDPLPEDGLVREREVFLKECADAVNPLGLQEVPNPGFETDGARSK